MEKLNTIKILLVGGARPNFMKIAPLMKELGKYPQIISKIVHTGQHYDHAMSKLFFEELEIPEADIYLGVGSSSHAKQTADIMVSFEKVLLQEKPDMIIVVGDVNSTIACSLVASKIVYPLDNPTSFNLNPCRRPLIAHVEAGLRSFDRTMPEEVNRILTDSISDLLFVTEPSGQENLLNEGIANEKIFLVGNVMIDTLLKNREKAQKSTILKRLNLQSNDNKKIEPYAIVTLHRPSNTDAKGDLENVLAALNKIKSQIPIIFPCHPRTIKQIKEFEFDSHFTFFDLNTKDLDPAIMKQPSYPILTIPPLGYLDFLKLMSHARFMLTDSGGIQEETTILGIPCITIRNNTERPITLSEGTNILAGTNKDTIVRESLKFINSSSQKFQQPHLWDGKASERIIKIILDKMQATGQYQLEKNENKNN